MSEPLVIADPELLAPPGQRFWTTAEMVDKKGRPTFTISEVSKFFFARTVYWARWAQHKGLLVLDGEPLEVPTTVAGAKAFRLYDVERMAHALAANGAIDGQQFARSVILVKTCGQNWGFLA